MMRHIFESAYFCGFPDPVSQNLADPTDPDPKHWPEKRNCLIHNDSLKYIDCEALLVIRSKSTL